MPGFFYPGWDAVKLLFEGVKVFRWIEIKEIQEECKVLKSSQKQDV